MAMTLVHQTALVGRLALAGEGKTSSRAPETQVVAGKRECTALETGSQHSNKGIKFVRLTAANPSRRAGGGEIKQEAVTRLDGA